MNINFDNANQNLDTQGLRCPDPLMLVRKTVRKMNVGETLAVLADDFSSIRDIPNFCRFMEHELLLCEIETSPYKFLIKKAK